MEVEIEKIYCIDTSVFVWVNRYYNFKQSWELLEELFKSNKVLSHIYVFDELTNESTNQDFVSTWLKPKKEYFTNISKRQTELVAQVLTRFPHLIKAKNEKNQADPWLVALAKETEENILESNKQHVLFPIDKKKKKEIIIISCEKVDHPSRIPAVCNHFKIKHMSLLEFFEDNGLVLQWTKKQ